MPGIHVRAASYLDWIKQERESVLTVPGSYWLCHKKNIYKFIFRYHRTDRTTREFGYVRELMKVIRKILKCQPSQGQQFGTQHLLVTYNHTSWTRQDKMFAMLKFREHTNAAAFSRAFVLTIKILNSEENTVKRTYAEICKDEDSDTVNGSTMSKERNLTSSLNISTTHSQSIEDLVHDVQCTKESNLWGTTDALSPETNALNKKQNQSTSIAKSDNDSSPTSPVNSCVLKRSMITSGNDIQVNDFQSNYILPQNTKCSESKSKSVPYFKEEHNMFSKLSVNNEDNRKENVEMTNDQQDILINTKDDTNTDSTNLPYQYFIEEDIRKTKSNITSPTSHTLVTKLTKNDSQHNVLGEKIDEADNHIDISYEHNLNKCEISSMQHDAEHEKNDFEMNDIKKTDIMGDISLKFHGNDRNKQRSIKECRKRILTNNVSRSSNITDLVMEGLMFTIRQDQDSVKVVEQKTKFEVDEVLENSEKAETKEGEKRLLNSSLLRLESLVTMLEPPEMGEKRISRAEGLLNIEDSLHYTLFQSTHSYSTNASTEYIKIDTPDKIDFKEKQKDYHHLEVLPLSNLSDITDTMDHTISGGTCFNIEDEKFNKLDKMEIQASKVKVINIDEEDEKVEEGGEEEDEEEEEEDIIPEALQSSIFQPTKDDMEITREVKNARGYQDLLMDDTEIENKAQHDDCISKVSWKHTNLGDTCSTHNENDFVKTENRICYKRLSNVPRVISNKIITLDQMPPALQNAIKNKLLKLQNNKNIATQHNKTSNLHDKTGSECDSYVDDDSSKSKILQKTTTFICDTNVNKIGSMSNAKDATASNRGKTIDNDNESGCFVEEKKEEHEEMITSSKIQDITKEFYKNLYQQHKAVISDYKKVRPQRKQCSIIENMEDHEIHLKMLKFIQDITRGVKVVVERISMKDMPNKLRKVSV